MAFKLNKTEFTSRWLKLHKPIKHISSSRIKNRLFEYNIKERVCEICSCTDIWENRPLSLHLHHKNGNKYDYRIENLIILCPNCHSQTPTYTGKKSWRSKKIIKDKCVSCDRLFKQNTHKRKTCSDKCLRLLRNYKIIKEKKCIICKTTFTPKRHKTKTCSKKCNYKLRGIITAKRMAKIRKRPDKKTMIKYLKNRNNLSEVGRIYDVSHTTVKNWLIYYNLPFIEKDRMGFN